jgi:hypothetical protein
VGDLIVDVRIILKLKMICECGDRIHVAYDSVKWHAVVNTVMNLPAL